MPPNSSVKTASVVRPVCEPGRKEYNDRHVIRTDFVLQNIYSYMIKNVHKFEAVRAANSEEEKLMVDLKKIVDDFQTRNGEKIQSLCTQLEVTMVSLNSTVYGVADELFVEGITWSRIIALFVFVAILTFQCIERNLSEDLVDDMYGCFCRLVKENLKPWIDDHGGWEGILSLKKDKPVGWTKNVFTNTFSILGSLVKLSNLPY